MTTTLALALAVISRNTSRMPSMNSGEERFFELRSSMVTRAMPWSNHSSLITSAILTGLLPRQPALSNVVSNIPLHMRLASQPSDFLNSGLLDLRGYAGDRLEIVLQIKNDPVIQQVQS